MLKLRATRKVLSTVVILSLILDPFLLVANEYTGGSGASAFNSDDVSNSGDLSHSFSFEVPPGTAGLQPSLSLNYSSSAKNGPYGYGWSLPYLDNKIQRSNKSGYAHYGSMGVPTDTPSWNYVNETAQLNGVKLKAYYASGPVYQDPQAPVGVGSYFKESFNTSGEKVLYFPSTQSWQVWNPDGSKYFYGSTVASRLRNMEITSQAPYSWHLDKIQDANGNYILITYFKDTATVAGVTYEYNIYPKTIEYSYHDGTVYSGEGHRLVELVWGARYNSGETAAMADKPTNYWPGFKMQTNYRLTEIRTGLDTNLDKTITASDQRLVSYKLIYANKPTVADPDQDPFSKLIEIKTFGSSGTEFPLSTKYTYSDPIQTAGFKAEVNWPNDSGAPPLSGQPFMMEFTSSSRYNEDYGNAALIDMNNDGIVDRLVADRDGVWKVYFGTGTAAGFAAPITWVTPYQPTYLYGMVYKRIRQVGLYQKKANGSNSQLCISSACWLTGVQNEFPEATIVVADLVDMNGDGRPDRVESTDSGDWRVFMNNGTGFNTGVADWPAPSPFSLLGVSNNNQNKKYRHIEFNGLQSVNASVTTGTLIYGCRLYDLNGDKKIDHVCRKSATEVVVSYNSGSGFGAAVLVTATFTPFSFAAQYNSQNNWMTMSQGALDFNGDGVRDAITSAPTYTGCGANQGYKADVSRPTAYSSLWATAFNTPQNVSTIQCLANQDFDFVQKAIGDSTTGSGQLEAIKSGTYVKLVSGFIDMNGDGILDRIVSGAGVYKIYYGLGDGSFLPTSVNLVDAANVGGLKYNWTGTTYSNDPNMPNAIQPNPNSSTTVKYPEITFNAALNSPELAGLKDLNGDGLVDQVAVVDQQASISQLWAQDAAHQDHDWRYFEHSGPSGLLTKVDNGMGGITEFEYTRRMNFKGTTSPVRADGQSFPDVNYILWNGTTGSTSSFDQNSGTSRLTGWVVTRKLVNDGVSSAPLEYLYNYYEPLSSPTGQNFRTVDVIHKFGTKEVKQRSFYYRIGQYSTIQTTPRLIEYYDETGTYSGQTEYLHTYGQSAAPNLLFWTKVTTRKTAKEGTLANVQDETVEKDAWPNIRSIKKHTNSGRDFASTSDNLITEAKFVSNINPTTNKYLVGFPYEVTTLIGTSKVRHMNIQYDNLALQVAPTVGLATRITNYGDPVALTSPYVTNASYDVLGNTLTSQSPEDYIDSATTTTIMYDSAYKTYPVTITNRLSHVTTLLYDSKSGKMLKILDPNGFLNCTSYDEYGRIYEASEYNATATNTSTACNIINSRTTYVNLGTPTTQYAKTLGLLNNVAVSEARNYFDGYGGVYKSARSENLTNFTVFTNTIDSYGRMTCSSMGVAGNPDSSYNCLTAGPRREYTYDSRNRLLNITRQPSNQLEMSVGYQYGNFDSVNDTDSIVTKTFYSSQGNRVISTTSNSIGQTISQTDSGRVTSYTYNTRGQLIKLDGPDATLSDSTVDGNILSFQYDNQFRLSKMLKFRNTSQTTSPQTWEYQYNTKNQLYRKVNPGAPNTDIIYGYDGLGRVNFYDKYPHGGVFSAEDIAINYDTGTNGKGQVYQVVVNNKTTTLNYDYRGLVFTKDIVFAGLPAGVSTYQYRFKYTYDYLGRLTRQEFPDTSYLQLNYTGNKLSSIVDSINGTLVDNFTYDSKERLKNFRYAKGSITPDLTFDVNTNRISKIKATNSVSASLMDFDYLYDVAGDPTTVTDVVNGNYSRAYTYDNLNRLLTASNSATGYSFSNNYQVDDLGELVKKINNQTFRSSTDANGLTTLTDIYSIPLGAPIRGFTYDGRGNRTSDLTVSGNNTLNWTVDDELTNYTNSSGITTDSVYDSAGERVHKIVKNSSNVIQDQKLYVDDTLEVDIKNNQFYKHYGIGPIKMTAKYAGNGLSTPPASYISFYNLISDDLGSPRVITDQTGAVVERRNFGPYGEILKIENGSGVTQTRSILESRMFTDQEYDYHSSLYNMGARYYDASVGRFISVDPALVNGEESLSRAMGESQALNPYSYVENRPTIYFDPKGASPKSIPATVWVHDMRKLSTIRSAGGIGAGPGGTATNATSRASQHALQSLFRGNRTQWVVASKSFQEAKDVFRGLGGYLYEISTEGLTTIDMERYLKVLAGKEGVLLDNELLDEFGTLIRKHVPYENIVSHGRNAAPYLRVIGGRLLALGGIWIGFVTDAEAVADGTPGGVFCYNSANVEACKNAYYKWQDGRGSGRGHVSGRLGTGGISGPGAINPGSVGSLLGGGGQKRSMTLAPKPDAAQAPKLVKRGVVCSVDGCNDGVVVWEEYNDGSRWDHPDPSNPNCQDNDKDGACD